MGEILPAGRIRGGQDSHICYNNFYRTGWGTDLYYNNFRKEPTKQTAPPFCPDENLTALNNPPPATTQPPTHPSVRDAAVRGAETSGTLTILAERVSVLDV